MATSTERTQALRRRRLAAELDAQVEIVWEAIDAYYNMTHDESAGEVRALTGREPVDRATTKAFVMAYGDLLRAKAMPTRLEVHNRMAQVARNLGLAATTPTEDPE